jgi:arabinogalactan oligomer/maltooligosaccharide transport system substrate-binding protein
LLIARNGSIAELADEGLLRPLESGSTATDLMDPKNQQLVAYDAQIYGVPLSLQTQALYYNKRLASDPPDSLDALLQEAADGRQVAFVPRFRDAYWGIQAFGQGLFDDEGHFTLAESGFTEWLSWLDAAQGAPGVILNVDQVSLQELFAAEQIAYYVGGPEQQKLIASMIDEEDPFEFGVVPLPEGPHGPAGPLLTADTILAYSYTSEQQAKIGESLAAFLVNQQQSIRFMRELGRVPANRAVAVDARIYPLVNGFAQQIDTAVVIPNEIPFQILQEAGERAYDSALSGLQTPEEAVCSFGLEVSEALEYSEDEISLPEGCTLPAAENNAGEPQAR